MQNNAPIVSAQVPDNEIITRVLNGEKELYSLVVKKYNQRLYRIGMSIINDDTEVEDVMQVTYIKAYENLPKFGFRSGFSTWLIRILINECLLRLKGRAGFVHLNNETMDKEMHERQISQKETPANRLLNAELKVILEQSVQSLPEKYRTVFIMREIEGMNVADTGDCLDISAVNVKVRLNRAKALLKESLTSFYKKEDILHFHLSRCDKMVAEVLRQI